MKTGKRISLALAIVLLVSALLTALPVSATAAGESTGITLGAGALTAGNKVYFGDQVLWRVLQSGDGKALLISNDTLDTIQFNPDYTDANTNVWAGSNAQQWCMDYYYDWPDGIEKNAILATSDTETNDHTQGSTSYYYKGGYGGNRLYGAASLNKEYFFFLSAKEADTLFSGDEDRKASGADSYWWLRSPNALTSDGAGIVDYDGWVHIYNVFSFRGARPAFNLNLDSVLFSSVISGNHKLTLKDENLKISLSGNASFTQSGETVTVTVPHTISKSDASKNPKAYVLITDKAYTDSSASVKQFTAFTDSKFTLDSSLTGTWGTDYHVYLLAINENGDNSSDYASGLVEIINAPEEAHTHSWQYTASGATITASCKGPGTCDITENLTIKINAPTSLTYDGTAKEAALSTGYNTKAFPDSYTIQYYQGSSELSSTPVNAGNYTAKVTVGNVTASVDYTITPAQITIKAIDKTKVYDNDATIDPALTATVTGVPEKGAAPVYSLSREEGQNVKEYAITVTAEATSNPNYTVSVENGTFSITPVAITIKADDKTKVYDNDTTTDPELSATVTGVPEKGVAPVYSLSREAGQDVKEYAITVTAEATANPNYTVSVENGTFSITPVAITIKAEDKTKVYDNDTTTDPALTATVTGVPEKGVAPVYSLSREEGQDVAEYAITVTAEAASNPNYTVTVESGKFTITPAAVTIKADDKTKVYDNDATTDPELTATVTGVPTNGTEPVYSLSRAAGQDVAEYAITVTAEAASNPNYTMTVEGGKFTITPAAVTIKADDKTKVYDNDATTDPELSATVTGVPEKGVAPVYSLSREAGQDADEYAITVTAEATANPNYTVTAESGKFTITQATENIVTVSMKGWTYGEAANKPTATATFGADIATFSYSSARNGTYTDKVPSRAAIWYVKATVAETANYAGGEAIASFTIATASSDITDPAAKAPAYTGEAQELVSAGKATGGTLQYALGEDATTAPNGGWDSVLPTGTDAGTYYVWYRVEGDANHDNTPPQCITVTLAKASAPAELPEDQLPQKKWNLADVDEDQELVTPPKALPEGYTAVQYSLDGGQTWADALPTGKTAGDYEVLARYIGDGNHEDFTTDPITVSIGSDPLREYVKRCYRLILNREGEEEGIAYWMEELGSGRQHGASIVDAFTKSDEFTARHLSDEEIVKIFYRAMLGREAEEGGYAFWLDGLREGRGISYLVWGFSISDEFAGICSYYGIVPGGFPLPDFDPQPIDPDPQPEPDPVEEYVRRCYELILGREGEEEGVEYWTNLLKTHAAAGADIVSGFVNSPEFTGRSLTNEEIVDIFYRTMLGREPEGDGYAFWLSGLAEGRGVDYLVWGFSSSPEFKAICASYGIEAGDFPMPEFVTATAETNTLLALSEEVIDLPEEPAEELEKPVEAEPDGSGAGQSELTVEEALGMEPELFPEELLVFEAELLTEEEPEL